MICDTLRLLVERGFPPTKVESSTLWCICLTCYSLLQVELIRRDYTANGGWETFLSYEDPEQGETMKLILQWNLSIADTLGNAKSVLISEVSHYSVLIKEVSLWRGSIVF